MLVYRIKAFARYKMILSCVALMICPSLVFGQSSEKDIASIIDTHKNDDVPAILKYSTQHSDYKARKAAQSDYDQNNVDFHNRKVTDLQKKLNAQIKMSDHLQKKIAILNLSKRESEHLRTQLTAVSRELEQLKKINISLKSKQYNSIVIGQNTDFKNDANQKVLLAINTKLAEKERLLDEANSSLSSIKSQLVSYEKKIDDLNKQITNLKQKENMNKELLISKENLLKKRENESLTRKEEVSAITLQFTNQAANFKKKFDEKDKALNEMLKKVKSSEDTIKSKDKTIAKLKTEYDTILKKIDLINTKKIQSLNSSLSGAEEKRAYSIGVSLGNEMLRGLESRSNQNMPLPKEVVLSGIRDSFFSQLRLDIDTINKELSEDAKSLNNNVTTMKRKSIKDGHQFWAKFVKQKGVIVESGVAIKVVSKGKKNYSDNDNVSVVMKESLTDGTVTVDMAASKKVWTETLKNYPPAFYAALKQIGYQGHVIVVVPPELAYGDNGLPPKIPPGSTIIYDITVMDK